MILKKCIKYILYNTIFVYAGRRTSVGGLFHRKVQVSLLRMSSADPKTIEFQLRSTRPLALLLKKGRLSSISRSIL